MSLSQKERPDLKYQRKPCPFLGKEVWAILTQGPEGVWKIANCLDKDTECFDHACAFTADGGRWPFEL